MKQTEDLLQELIEQLEIGEAVDRVAADLPAEEAEVIRLIAALRQMPEPSTDEAIVVATGGAVINGRATTVCIYASQHNFVNGRFCAPACKMCGMCSIATRNWH